ncbi:allatostatin-A receptor-like [Littorina saxatilis]|uniref:G-protein coupled receptors family 1 profile domain-containing protein n=1 Tax=Littorina saxatilis TaxID=31220 RepID=A0AAN9C3L4_9CAEN
MTTATVHLMTQDVLVACIMLSLTALVGLLGNLLMMRALWLYKNLRIDFFILLGSAAVSDMLCLCVSVPRHIIYLTWATDPITNTWCKASKYLEVGSGFVAAYHLVFLAVLRGILLTSRGRNPPTPAQTLILAVGLWAIALPVAIPFLLNTEEVFGFCQYVQNTDVERDVWLQHSLSCFVPVALIIAVYVLAHYMGKRYFQDSYTYREKQISKLVTVIVSVFVVCQLPFRVLDLHVLYKETEAQKMEAEGNLPDGDTLESLYIARNYLLCLMMADKAVRPVIYSKLAPELAEAFDEVINCTMCHRAYTQGRIRRAAGRGGGGEGASKANGHANGHATRIASTSSNAPLTAESLDTGSDSAIEHDKEKHDEMEIVQLNV